MRSKLAIVRGCLTLVGKDVDKVGARFLLEQGLDKVISLHESDDVEQGGDSARTCSLSHRLWPWKWEALAAAREARDGKEYHITILSRSDVLVAATFLQQQRGECDGDHSTSTAKESNTDVVLAAARAYIGTSTVMGTDWFPVGVGSTRRRSDTDPFSVFEVIVYPRAEEFRRAVLGSDKRAAGGAAATAVSGLHLVSFGQSEV